MTTGATLTASGHQIAIIFKSATPRKCKQIQGSSDSSLIHSFSISFLSFPPDYMLIQELIQSYVCKQSIIINVVHVLYTLLPPMQPGTPHQLILKCSFCKKPQHSTIFYRIHITSLFNSKIPPHLPFHACFTWTKISSQRPLNTLKIFLFMEYFVSPLTL